MLLTELEPTFMQWKSPVVHQQTDDFSKADGIMFKCPECFIRNGNSVVGVHSIICWKPNVDQNTNPKPGRWNFIGTGYDDLTLEAGSSSVKVGPPCNAHFFIRNGNITMAL